MKKTSLFTLLLVFVLFGACKSNNSNSDTKLTGVFVMNEGNFGQANASITAYNPETGEVSQNQYEDENGVPIGDILQSVTEINERLYLVVNNSHKIEVVDKATLTNIATIQIANEASPRYVAQVSDTKAYVTNLFGNSVSVINLETNEVTGTIAVGSNPEGIAVVGNLAYVANSGFGSGNTVSVINTDSDEVVDTITVGDNPTSFKVTSNGNIWLVCVGAFNDFNDPNDDTPGTIYVINGNSGEVVTNFEVGGHPGDLVISERESAAFLVNGPLMKINLITYEIEDSSFINRNFYALGLSTSDESEFLWGTDAKNFAQAGLAIQYDLNGVKQDSFPTGIIPGDFYFSAE